MDVSIIIVNYNTKNLLRQCLYSIYQHTIDICFEIIVVDNASTDESLQMLKKDFPHVKLIKNTVNLGFGKANNLGAQLSLGKYLFFLNSDCILIENTAKAFYDYMEINNIDGSLGVVGALLYNEMMKLNTSYHKFPTITGELKLVIISLLNKLLHKSLAAPITFHYSQSQFCNEVEFITGADLFMLKKRFDELNGFDEQFFLYFEESDLQKRMSAIGLKRIILRDQKIIHLEGHSSKTTSPTLKSTLIFRDSMYKYFWKHTHHISYISFYLIITPLIIYPVFFKKYPTEERKEYCRMLIRNGRIT